MNIIYNGEIYLKRGPEIIDPRTSFEYQKLEEIISDIKFDASKENPDTSKLGYLDQLEEYKSFLDTQKTITNYLGTNTFWQLYTIDGKHIIMKNNEPHPLIRDYNKLEELSKDFIKLSDFLNISTFVGRQFIRTSHRLTLNGKIDKSFMPSNNIFINEKYIVLYAMQDLFLIRVVDDPLTSDRYELINSKYTIDGNYKFIGKTYSEYKDKQKVYTEIFEQLTGNQKKKKKIK